MANQSVKALAIALPTNIKYLASLISRKPTAFSPEWASTISESFSLYTNTITVNFLLATNDRLSELNWPFPGYIDIRKELYSNKIFTTFFHKYNMIKYIITGRISLNSSLIAFAGLSNEEQNKHIFRAMRYLFSKHANDIFGYWENAPILKSKFPIIRDIQNTYRKKYWAACIPTTLSLLDYLMRVYFQSDTLNVSIQTLRNAFEKAGLLPKDLKPGYAIWDGTKDSENGNTFFSSTDEDLRLPGVFLSSFVEFANSYYSWAKRDLSSNQSALNRHTVMHCASEYWTEENCIKILTFFDLGLRLEPALKIIIHGSGIPKPKC